jgi:hypothetical protein
MSHGGALSSFVATSEDYRKKYAEDLRHAMSKNDRLHN